MRPAGGQRDQGGPGAARGGAQDAGERGLMRRRRILAGLVLTLVAPLGAEAQQAGTVYRIGFLSGSSAVASKLIQ